MATVKKKYVSKSKPKRVEAVKKMAFVDFAKRMEETVNLGNFLKTRKSSSE